MVKRSSLLLALLALPAILHAQERIGADKGKLLLTAGFSDVEGVAGGGLVPWAVITGYGTDISWGANAHYTDVRLKEFDLETHGVARRPLRPRRSVRHAAQARRHGYRAREASKCRRISSA